MNSRQKSILFWCIFLIIVAVILIVLFPKYGRLSKQFTVAQARNLAANLTSSSAANYTQRKSNASIGVPVKNCQDVMNIVGNRLPPGYEITNQEIPPDKVGICVLTGPYTKKVEFSIVGIN